MTNEDFAQLYAEALEIDQADLSDDTAIADIEEWDSVGWLALIALVDERFGVTLPAKDLRALETVGAVSDFIRSKLPQVR